MEICSHCPSDKKKEATYGVPIDAEGKITVYLCDVCLKVWEKEVVGTPHESWAFKLSDFQELELHLSRMIKEGYVVVRERTSEHVRTVILTREEDHHYMVLQSSYINGEETYYYVLLSPGDVEAMSEDKQPKDENSSWRSGVGNHERTLIQEAYKKHRYELSLEQAEVIWSQYSRWHHSSKWTPVPNDLDFIFSATREYAKDLGYIVIFHK